ncbi:PilN domain-containing protein [Candidatus Nitrotoga sp. 1052]|uniref:PilN domain-containing protein n=1 Tax=Candidatus Nitrotoga sp. 1052 TaxID=2886964 RepID=UPI001EF69DED|nr:PilN domain-containing protein [Candidatus Nitrotoga sp. 1052]CAH1089894.1 Type IV pilus inner membrane component PilN [Candidatus Nitrotoga sp. 1052]
MIRINLLPHRAEKRKARQIQFYAFSAITLVLAAMLVGFVHVVINTQIEYQERRNRYLTDQMVLLDKQIAEIKRLKMEIAALMERKTVVEKLQSTRSDVVHLLDQMLNILPESVYLKTIKQTGNKINLVGFTQSNARVSTLMRSIDSSQWLDSPTLVQISATTANANGPRLNEFTLNFNLTTLVPTTPAAPAKTAGTKG